ncbi:H(+)-ATPase 7 [Striga asiatica]|uniref:H(+)-ATPase 7 n=1 Tax=Striga asiatica TaxID=4170 RepID=A0A5A7Q2Y0_STRAF|nr:H(+)-ATPase 7 [Striga asiatica]
MPMAPLAGSMVLPEASNSGEVVSSIPATPTGVAATYHINSRRLRDLSLNKWPPTVLNHGFYKTASSQTLNASKPSKSTVFYTTKGKRLTHVACCKINRNATVGREVLIDCSFTNIPNTSSANNFRSFVECIVYQTLELLRMLLHAYCSHVNLSAPAQFCPLDCRAPLTAICATCCTSTSSQTIKASFPPSLKVTDINVSAAFLIIIFPTPGDPTKIILSTEDTKASPVSANPVMTSARFSGAQQQQGRLVLYVNRNILTNSHVLKP